MLSDDLRVAEHFLARMAKGEISATADNLYNVKVIVSCCQEMARNMEQHSVIAQAVTQADLADGKVVMLPVVGRDVRRLVSDGNPGGGAA